MHGDPLIDIPLDALARFLLDEDVPVHDVLPSHSGACYSTELSFEARPDPSRYGPVAKFENGH